MLPALKAGPFEAKLDGADLRYVRFRDVEVVRRILIGVRDAQWRTVSPQIARLALARAASAFEVRFDVSFRGEEVHLSGHGMISAEKGGGVRYACELVAQSDFRYARIGICVLHPAELCAGRRYEAAGRAGTHHGTLPRVIGAQPSVDDIVYPLVPAFTGLSIDMDGIQADFRFEGDVFELEDQRNWTDASFKSYSTEVALGQPLQARAGQVFAQSVTVRCRGAAARGVHLREPHARVAVGGPLAQRLPHLGTRLPDNQCSFDRVERALLADLRLDHLRVDVALEDSDWLTGLQRGADAAAAVDANIELAVIVHARVRHRLAALARAVVELRSARVVRVLVFHADAPTTPGPWLGEVRRHLAPVLADVVFASGSDGAFAEINRGGRLHLDGTDGVSWSIDPTIHADDDLSVMETVTTHAEQVASARGLAPGKRLFVSSVEFGAGSALHGESRSCSRDAAALRQISPFAAAWTVASIAHLGRAGIDAVTYFEAIGSRGLIGRQQAEAGTAQASWCAPYPLYSVFELTAEWRSALLLDVTVSDPWSVAALGVGSDSRWRVVVANLTPEEVQVTVSMAGVGRVTAPAWAVPPRVTYNAGAIVLALAAYAIAVIDCP